MRLQSRSAALRIAVAAAAVAVAGSALAQPAAIQSRQQNFKAIGGAFKSINDELKKDSPDIAVIRAGTAKMRPLVPQIPRWFPKGSGAETGVKTGAKPEIWTDNATFVAGAQRLQGEFAKLDQLATAGDLAAIKTQVRATGGACKGCHDKFREEEKK